MAYRAVLFDLDGTLLDSIADLADAMNAALAAHGLPPRPVVAEHKTMVGDGVAAYILRALPAGKRDDAALVAKVTADYRAAYAARWRNQTRPYEGVADLLDRLAGLGIRLAVLSNKPEDTTRATVEAFLGLERFDVVRGALDGVPLKPDPRSAVRIAAEMDLTPAEFLYVGDTATDMKTANAAGMFAVGALWGFRGIEELHGAGARALIERPAELLDLL